MKIKEKLFCNYCGSKLDPSKNNFGFCPNCGVRIKTRGKGRKEIVIEGENAEDVKKVMNSASKNSDDWSEIKISAPWGHTRQGYGSKMGYSKNSKVQENFIKERSRVHLEYIKENEKTKRISLVTSAILLVFGLLIIIYCPTEKQTLSNWIGGSLIILAAGTAGYKQIWAKSKIIEIKADQDKE